MRRPRRGRPARRQSAPGRYPVDVYLVDAAFEDEATPWAALVAEVIERWTATGRIDEMRQLHGSVVRALAEYAGVGLHALENAT